MALERRDVDRRAAALHVRRTVSDGQVVELGKTSRSRRQVPLSRRAVAALDGIPPRLDPPLLFSAPEGGLLNLDNFRRRDGTRRSRPPASPARPHLRHELHVRLQRAAAGRVGLRAGEDHGHVDG